MKYALLIIVFLFSSSLARGQAGQATEIKNAPSDPAICNSARGWQYFNTTSSVMKYCSATNTWTSIGASSIQGATAGVFNISTSCPSTATNCLTWVDDDSTDNCGAATTAFMALINGYAGKGVVQVSIGGSGPGKAYKLATCNLIFSNARGANIVLTGTIDCAMALQSCIQLNATSTSGAAVAYPQVLQVFRLSGGGGLIGGTSLTGSGGNGSATAAGVYIMPQTAVAYVEDIFFGGSGTNAGFGPVTTMGAACPAWSLYVDFPMSGAWVSHVDDDVNSTDTTHGGCGMGNPNGRTTGSNTVFFTNNFVYTQGEAGGVGQCGDIGISDGGSLGGTLQNNIFGFALPVQIQGVGHRTAKNQLDSTQCTAGGVSATIQVGGSSAVGPEEIEGNVIQLNTGLGHAADFIAIQNGATATLTGTTIIGNMNNTGSSGLMFPASSIPCTPITGTVDFCNMRDNQGITEPGICAANFPPTYSGWTINGILANCFPAAASANITASAMYTPALGIGTTVFCQVILTQAATTSSTLPQCTVTYTDLWSNTSQTVLLTPAWAASTAGCTGSTTNTVGNSCQGSTMISPKAATAVTFNTINYASVGGTVMQYQAFAQAGSH